MIRLARSHPEWALGFQDETWWSRLAQPELHTFSAADARLELEQKQIAKDDPDPKALACYGVLVRGAAGAGDRPWLRFVDGRPLSGLTTQFLAWGSAKLAAEGKRAWLLVWDNAPWHVSKAVRAWVRQHGIVNLICRGQADVAHSREPRCRLSHQPCVLYEVTCDAVHYIAKCARCYCPLHIVNLILGQRNGLGSSTQEETLQDRKGLY